MKRPLLFVAPSLLLLGTVASAQVPAATPAPAVTSLPAAPAPAVNPLPALPEPAVAPTGSPLAAKLGIGKDGFWQPSANLQFWAFGANQAGDTSTTLRIRRAELRVKGEIIPQLLGFNVMIDPARVTDSKSSVKLPTGESVTVANQGTVTVLQDFFITFMSDFADVSLGQFKIPLSLEGYGSASKLLFPERAIVSRRFGDKRDLGIRAEKK